MSTDVGAARDDLAFLRALVERRPDETGAWAEGYFAGGLIYGAQMLMHAAQGLGWLPTSGLAALGIGIGPSLVFLPTLVWITWRRRADKPPAAAGRAIAAVFGAVGLANLTLIVVIGWVAWRERSLAVWLIYPACVFILQGAAWAVAYCMRRRAWLALVAAGWFAFALAMGFSVELPGAYVLFAGLGIWLCMALPGWLMMRGVARPAA
jgi:hypothetical protein